MPRGLMVKPSKAELIDIIVALSKIAQLLEVDGEIFHRVQRVFEAYNK